MKFRSAAGLAIVAVLVLGAMPPASAAQGPDPIEYVICVYEERSPSACYPPDELPDPGQPVPPFDPVPTVPPVDPGQPTVPPIDPGQPTVPPIDPGDPTIPSVPSVPGTPAAVLHLLCMPHLYPFGAFCILAQDGQLGPKLTAVRHYLAQVPGKSEFGEASKDCLRENPTDSVGRVACIVLRLLGQ